MSAKEIIFGRSGGVMRIPALFIAAVLIWPSAAGAEERLPWAKSANSYDRQSGSYDTARSDYDNGSRHDGSYQENNGDYRPPVIRQPRQNPYQEPYRAPRQRSSSNSSYNSDDVTRPAPRAPAYRPPYRSEYNDPPARTGRRANYDSGYDNNRRYDDRGYREPAPTGSYSMDEVLNAGGRFFGSVSKGMASVIEYAFKRSGRPNGYILGEGAGGAFIAGLRYGEGTLYTKNAGRHRVYWQGPSIGYDAGAEGSKTMVLVYNMRRPSDIYHRFGGVAGSAFFIGGVGITFQKRKHVIMAPIRAGVGLRFGANVGYLKYTRRPTWNPF